MLLPQPVFCTTSSRLRPSTIWRIASSCPSRNSAVFELVARRSSCKEREELKNMSCLQVRNFCGRLIARHGLDDPEILLSYLFEGTHHHQRSVRSRTVSLYFFCYYVIAVSALLSTRNVSANFPL